MTASERLRELDTQVKESGFYGAIEANWLMDALPELVAVVEAAERCKPLHPTLTAYVSLGALEPLHEALAALEEKLS